MQNEETLLTELTIVSTHLRIAWNCTRLVQVRMWRWAWRGSTRQATGVGRCTPWDQRRTSPILCGESGAAKDHVACSHLIRKVDPCTFNHSHHRTCGEWVWFASKMFQCRMQIDAETIRVLYQ